MAPPDALSAFLHFGYLPGADEGFVRPLAEAASLAESASLAGRRPEDVLRLGAEAMRADFAELDAGLHVVPLTGGLDSRAVLALLIDGGVKDRVVAVTMGTPGTFDYEIGKRVAKRAEVMHEAIDLTRVPYAEDHLVSLLCGARTPAWAFDFFYHRLIPTRFGREATYWSGFMGDVLAGGALPRRPSASWPAAIAHFAAENRFCRSIALARPGFEPGAVLPAKPLFEQDTLGYDDQLDFSVRQARYIAPNVLVDGHEYRTPFLHPAWVRFILGLPPSHRGHQEQLYAAILRKTFPSLFNLPTKNTFGLPLATPGWAVTGRRRLSKGVALLRRGGVGALLRRGPLPDPFQMLNYIDFARGLAERADLRQLIHDTLSALDDRGVVPWLSGMELWKRQQGSPGETEVALALTLLSSLELHLRADERRQQRLLPI